MHYLILLLAALAAGAINSVAGGGTLLTFPALLAVGVSPVAANATSTVALVPGSVGAFWGYRDEMGSGRGELIRMGIPSLVGGLIGAILVIKAGDALFSKLVPWLIFSATVLFMAQEPIRRRLEKARAASGDEADPRHWVGVMAFQFVVAIYGGFFGAGIGILMLAALGILGLGNIHRLNGLKNFAAVCINGVAAITFALMHRVHWAIALLMMVGAIVGGYSGAGVARKLGEKNVRRLVIGIGVFVGVYTLVRPV